MNCFNDNQILLDSDLMIKLETEVPTIEEQLFNDNLNPDITGTFGLFREWAMLSGKITQFMSNQEILYSDKDIEYTSEPLKLAESFEFSISKDDNFELQSKNIHSTTDKFNINDFLTVKSQDSERADSTVKNNCWVSRCGIFCSVCKLKYPNKFDFDRHYLQTHFNNNEIVYTCSLCNEEDVNYNRFRNHCYRHFAKGRIKCSHCPTIRFTQERHLLAHTKLFHEYDTVDTSTPDTATRVIRSSNAEHGTANMSKADSSSAFCDKTDILCGMCKMKCVSKIVFDNHFRKMHPRSEVIYACPVCSDDFHSFKQFKIHRNSQHDTSKLSCSDDLGNFNRKKNFFKHKISVHDEEGETDASLYSNLNGKDSKCYTTRDVEKCQTWEFKDTKNLVQKRNSNVDIKNGTNIDNCIKLEKFCENISHIFSSDENQNIDLQVQYNNNNGDDTEISNKTENNNSWCSQSVMSESDLSDLISNIDDVNGLDSEMNDWRTYIGILCGKCNQKFSAKNAFDDHYQLEHDKSNIIYTCPLCKCEHDNYERFRGHCYRHFTKGRFKCCYCSSRFPKLYRLSAHIKAVHPESRQPEGLLLDFPGSVDSQWQPPSVQSSESHCSSEVKSECPSSGRNAEGKGQKHLNSWLSCYGIFCCKCKMKFRDKLSFQTHYRERHSETNIIYTCSSCNQEYDNYKCFSNHCLRHFNRGSYKCKLCSKSFSKYPSFSAHMKEVHSDNKKIVTFVCNFCNKVYLTQDRLNQHKMSSCPSDANSVCKNSSSPAKVYISSESSVENSIEMYNSSNSNTKSDYFFLGSNASDTPDRRSVLSDVSDNSSRKSCNWLIHYGILCVKCKQKFPGKNLFVNHYQKVHPESDVLYTCSVCIEEFKTYRRFISHGYRHFVRGRLKCHYCPILFSHLYQLEAHLKAFTWDKSHSNRTGTNQDRHDTAEVNAIDLSQDFIQSNEVLEVNLTSNPIQPNLDNIIDTKLSIIEEINNFSQDHPVKTEDNCVLVEEPFCDVQSKDLTLENSQNVPPTDSHLAAVEDIPAPDCASDDISANVEAIRQSHLKILCRLCKEKFSDKGTFDRHFEEKHPDWHLIYSCSLCECTENTYDDFINHLCNICDLLRKRKPLAKSDNWIRYGILCGKCDKKFIVKYLFLKHYRESHPGCRLAYSCAWCKKEFENYENFRGHCYRHSVKGRFRCRYCPTRFTKFSRMSAHVKAIHCNKKRPGVFLLSCEICNIRFSSRSHLHLHSLTCGSARAPPPILSHLEEEESVLCLLCNKKYESRAEFQIHACPEIKSEPSPTSSFQHTLSDMIPRSYQSFESNVYCCQLCDSVFQSCDELELHNMLCNSSIAGKCGAEDGQQIENTFCVEIQKEFKMHQPEKSPGNVGNELSPQPLVDSFNNETEQISPEFNFPSRLKNTIGSWNSQSNIMCGKCKQTFAGKVLFDGHFEKEHGGHEVVYACATCDREYRTYHSFRFHRYRHMGRFMCSQCPSRFSLQSSLSAHTARHHSGGGVQFPCHLCNKHYHTEPGLKLHIRSRHIDSRKRFKCELCGNVLHSKNGFLLHMETHKLGFQFMCHVCGSRFKQKINMIEHVQYSHRKLQFSCHSCPKSYHRKSYLTKHISERHSTVKKQCGVCSRWYRNEYCLRKHSLIHVERPHTCSACGKRFLSSAKLKQHTNTHTGQKPHQCQHCQKAFTNFPNLLKHNKRQHKHVNRHEATLDPNNVTEKDPSLYDKNWMQPTISALDNSIQSVIITSENLKHSVINKKSYEVKDRNKDIVSCSKSSTDSSLELFANYQISDSESVVSMASHGDSIRLYSEVLGNQDDTRNRSRRAYSPEDLRLGHDDVLPHDGWPKVNLRDITLGIKSENNHSNETSAEMQIKQDTHSSSDRLLDTKLPDRVDRLPGYWADVREATRQSTHSESNKQTENIQNDIFKELLGNIDFLIEEEIPPNIFFKDEIETEELLSRNLSKQDHESSHNREQEQTENNHAFHLSTRNMASLVPASGCHLSPTGDRSRNPTLQPGLRHAATAQLLIHSNEQLSGSGNRQSDTNTDTIVEQPRTGMDTSNKVLTINVNLSTSPVISNANDLKYSIHRDTPDHTADHSGRHPISPLPPYSFNSPFADDQNLLYDICAGSDTDVNHAMPNEIDQRIVNCSPSPSCNDSPGADYDCFIDNLDFGFHFAE